MKEIPKNVSDSVRRRNPHLYPNEQGSNPTDRDGACPVVEPPAWHDTLAAAQVEGPHTGKFLVRVVSYRTRLLDEDNLAEKYHVDACRYAGLIPSDAPGQTKIEVSQEKVRKKAEARTEIEISPLP